MAEFVRTEILDTPTRSLQAWEGLASFGKLDRPLSAASTTQSVNSLEFFGNSSAHDQFTDQRIAVKKVINPFSTPVLAKRTYREFKLLEEIKHENIVSLCYFITELLGTDLDRLMASRQLGKQYIQYFLYQIMV
ncbi:Mitogen-activated protein kinase HOG1 [Beauveria bassiana]|nr:Mitogen-activated protein kinase HOG1 [Beauveria bassiana]